MRICFCPRVRTRNPFAKHSWHTGCADWNFDETSSATGRGLALPHLKQTSGKPRLLTMLLLACTIMFGSDRTSLLNSSGRFFFFFFEFPPKATRAGDEKQRNKKQWPKLPSNKLKKFSACLQRKLPIRTTWNRDQEGSEWLWQQVALSARSTGAVPFEQRYSSRNSCTMSKHHRGTRGRLQRDFRPSQSVSLACRIFFTYSCRASLLWNMLPSS